MTVGRRAPRESAARQAISAIIIVAAIVVTVFGGLLITLAETSTSHGETLGPTSTVYRIPTIALGGGAQLPTSETSSATPTDISLPSVVPSRTSPPTRQPTQVVTIVSSPIEVSDGLCMKPANWVAYTVQPGDTLFIIGLRYGLLVNSLMKANCLASETIETGQTLLVPPITPMTVSGSVAPSTDGVVALGATATHTNTDGSCTASNSIITTPAVGAVLKGKSEIKGTASVPDFSYYKLEIREDGGPGMFVTFFTATTPVVNGLLAELNTQAFRNGAWWLRVIVVNTFNTYPEPCSIMVYINN